MSRDAHIFIAYYAAHGQIRPHGHAVERFYQARRLFAGDKIQIGIEIFAVLLTVIYYCKGYGFADDVSVYAEYFQRAFRQRNFVGGFGQMPVNMQVAASEVRFQCSFVVFRKQFVQTPSIQLPRVSVFCLNVAETHSQAIPIAIYLHRHTFAFYIAYIIAAK